ncbi:MAG: histidinol-phosphate aminotransferase family protein [Pseudodesulfovibrio sp.]
MGSRKVISRLAAEALGKSSGDYVSKDHDELAQIEALKREHGLDHVYRFDVGKNTDGFTPLISDVLDMPQLKNFIVENTIEYPDNHYQLLRRQLAMRFELDPEFFVMAAGLESMIDHIARAFFDPGDQYVIPVPNFSVFEGMSNRMQAEAVFVPLSAQLQWTEETTQAMVKAIAETRPKLVWISNPVNPTGQHVPLHEIRKVVDACKLAEVPVVVDEAYGEYSDTDDGYVSAAAMVPENPHLMVLRTFSKMYSLPSARVGYMMCASPELRAAVNLYRPMFPFSWFSLYLAQLAVLDDDYIVESRTRLARRKAAFMDAVSGFTQFEFIPSDTNTLMFRHASLSADELVMALTKKGILTANLNKVDGIEGLQFLRMTIRSSDDNAVFVAVCEQINRQS